jgi:hypothetical protein
MIRLGTLSLTLVTILTPGCDFHTPVQSTEPTMQVFGELLDIWGAYATYCTSTGNAPANLEQLLPYIRKDFADTARPAAEALKTRVKNGDYVIVWNEQRVMRPELSPSQKFIIAYEKGVPEKGGFVVMTGGGVGHISAAKFAESIGK